MALPSDISGLYAWYRASSFGLNDGDTCGNWIDSSGNGRTLTAGGTPVFKNFQIAGYPCVRYVFSESDKHSHATFNWLTNLANLTLFAVFRSLGTGGGGAFIGSNSKLEALCYDGSVVFMRSGSAGVPAVGGTLALNSWAYAYGCQTNGAHGGCSLNGAAEVTAAASGRGASTELVEVNVSDTSSPALAVTAAGGGWTAFGDVYPANQNDGDNGTYQGIAGDQVGAMSNFYNNAAVSDTWPIGSINVSGLWGAGSASASVTVKCWLGGSSITLGTIGDVSSYSFSTATKPGGGAWTKADVASMFIEFASAGSGNGNTIRHKSSQLIVSYVVNGIDLVEWFVFSADLSNGDKAAMNAYLRGKYFDVVPTQNEGVREGISRRLWASRRPPTLLEVTAPLRLLDADIGDRLAMETQIGPEAAGSGWRGKKWQRRPFTVQRMAVDFATPGVRLQLLDRSLLDVLLWDTARTDITAVGIDTTRGSGVAQILKGGAAIAFVRAPKAWVENPGDLSSVAEIASNAHAYTVTGEYLEEARTNEITRSSFVDGTTGLTLTGTGTNGSAIATDPDERLFIPEVLAPSLKFTAGNAHTADLKAAFPVTASIPGGTDVRLTIDHRTVNGEPLHYQLTRGVDGNYWNDGSAAFQAGAINNSLGTQSTRDPAARYHSKKIPVGAGATTLTPTVLLPSGGVASRVSYLYHAQIEKGSFATSRLVSTGGVAQVRAKSEHTIDATTAAKVYDPAVGTLFCELVPEWSSADLGSAEDRYVFYMETNGGADHDALFYDASAGGFVFERKVGGSTYTTSRTATVTRGTAIKLAARWTGTEAELDLTAYTISVFVDGVKGTDATSAAPTFTSPETLQRGHDGTKANHVNGALREVRVYSTPLTDSEIAALP